MLIALRVRPPLGNCPALYALLLLAVALAFRARPAFATLVLGVLAVFPESRAVQGYEDFEGTMATGDRIVLYTDGISEARHDGQVFGGEDVRRCVQDYGDLPCDDLATEILRAAGERAGGRITAAAAIVVVELRRERQE